MSESVISQILDVLGGFGDTIKETFFVFEKFIHSAEIGSYSIWFAILTLLFFSVILFMIGSPAYIGKLVSDNKQGISEMFNNMKGKGKNVFERIKK